MNEHVAGSAFGELLRSHRLAAGLTQETLAERARMSAVGVGALERGNRQAPYRATVALLTQALGLSTDAAAELQVAAARPQRPHSRRRPSESGQEALRRDNLPLALSSFLGREQEVAGLDLLLETQRLVTLTGPGGVGKTRLAVEFAATCIERFPDGVWFVDLAPLREPALVTATVAAVLGVREQLGIPLVETLAAALHTKRILLLLDNCEHLLSEAAHVAEQLVRACPQLRILSTSREPLRVGGEWVSRVDPLPLPTTGDEQLPSLDALTASPAVRLFCERAAATAARAVDPAINRAAVATIVRRLDGLPLAIELAAARAHSLSLQQIAGALDARFRVLTTGSRTALPRQQTLRATLDWSFDLLSERERTVFRRCAIFSGGWLFEAAQAVCGDDETDAWGVADCVMALMEKSLIVRALDRDSDEPRFAMLETTCQYAREQLNASGEHERIARRHAEYYRNLAEHADATSGARETSAWLAFCAPELDNFRAALAWTLDEGNAVNLGAALAGALGLFFARLFQTVEGVNWCERALAALGTDPVPTHEAALRLALARLYGLTSGPHQKLPMAERAAILYRRLRDRRQLAWALIELGHAFYLLGRRDEADRTMSEALLLCRELGNLRCTALALRLKSSTVDWSDIAERQALLAESLDVYRAIGDAPGIASALGDLAELTFATGDVPRALAYGREALALCSTPNSGSDVTQSLVNVAAYALASGKLDEAGTAAREALAIARRASDTQMVAWAIQHLAGVSAMRGESARAACLLGAADAQIAALGVKRAFTEQSTYDGTRAALSAVLGQQELAMLLADGQAWSIDRAVDEALPLV